LLSAGGQNPRAKSARKRRQLGAGPFRRCCGGSVATGRIIVPICDTQPKDPKVVTEAFPISRFPVPDLANLPEDIRNRILVVQEKSGFIPNVFLVLAHRPDEFRAFFAYHDALMDKAGNLTKAEREMIVVATSNSNQCQYCVIAHGAILRIRAKNPLISDQVAINYRKADITERQKVMLDFALKVSRAADTVGEADFDVLKSHGFNDEDIWDIAAIAAFFALSNRIANVTAMRPNPEFYTMGRS
jgi:uncharacterized peroxidase-related enzyme